MLANKLHNYFDENKYLCIQIKTTDMDNVIKTLNDLSKIGLKDSDISEYLMSNLDLFIRCKPDTISKWRKEHSHSYDKNFDDILKTLIQLLKETEDKRKKESNSKKLSTLKNMFFDELKKCPTINLSTLSQRLRVKEDEILRFIVANPTIVFSLIDKDYVSTNDNGKLTYLVSKAYHYNANQIGINLFNEQNEDFDDFYNGGKDNKEEKETTLSNKSDDKGIFLGHSLSPYSESICLLYELGRFKRIAEIFKTKHKIFLTGADWAEYNNSVRQIDVPKDNLNSCLSFRDKLYKQMGIDYEIINAQYQYQGIDINKQSTEYATYSDFLEQATIMRHKNAEKQQMLNFIEQLCNRGTNFETLPNELQLLTFSIIDDKKNLYVIHTVKKHFDLLDYNTFFYTLQQRFAQHKYIGWTKIAVESEQKFDASFIKMENAEGNPFHFGAVYYKHYYFKKENDRPLNIIPYTFPSGRVWDDAKKEKSNNIPEAIKKAVSDIILIWDFENSKPSKIKKLIDGLDLTELAIQMSDLFSFCNSFFSIYQNHLKFWNDLKNILYNIDKGECYTSWEKCLNQQSLLNDFCDKFLTVWYDDVIIPYFFYPFLYIEQIKNENNLKIRETREKTLRDNFCAIINLILNSVHNKIQIEEWKK